jgi:NAD(P)-dependent dehydrogenase (short-subunit alcohol dehydrogenase family)
MSPSHMLASLKLPPRRLTRYAQPGDEAWPYSLINVTRLLSPRQSAASVRVLGRMDILVNNAAWNIGIPFMDLDTLTADIWDRHGTPSHKGIASAQCL